MHGKIDLDRRSFRLENDLTGGMTLPISRRRRTQSSDLDVPLRFDPEGGPPYTTSSGASAQAMCGSSSICTVA
jgi:hypothetical protein